MFQIQRTERGGQPGQGVDPDGRAPQGRSERPVRQDLALTEGGEPLEYLTFPLLERTGIVKHLFTTRLGGVSRGECATMNFSVDRDENRENVLENYRRIARVLDCRVEDMVASHQTHTTNIRRMTSVDKGKGILRPRDYADVDGMVTDEPGLVLNTFYADCVPLYFVDPVHRAVGLAHSGWRGTVGRMGARMVEAMGERFGSRPEEIYAAVGPSICRDCYEVSGDVAEQFIRMLGEAVAIPGREPGKYQLDLWLANELILRQAGLLPAHIAVTDICTCHNSGYLFSHRASGGRRGSLAAFLALKD
ncbi:peptidoglycan editing factor PgeF [uncultured Acetatifactor sp.]|uniref:peptidoglycan editing factor PgeF n=1 Tax=uncultured Acetatifactor sp. TaxID=1671927 RepID=UPI00262B4D8F|nr:peptidoglycan editing factor PgeF [uncultured Acetatifactor sp.]